MNRFLRLGMLTLSVSAFHSAARADLLIDPTGGTVLFGDSASYDDQTTHVTLGFTGHFFGSAYSAIDVGVNGNLNFSANTEYLDSKFPGGAARIAPLWDDLYLTQGSGQSITAQSGPGGAYYSVTWNVGSPFYNFPFNTQTYQFQATIFGSATTLLGFGFQADDIVFSYASNLMSPLSGGDAVVGLNKGDNQTYAALPGSDQGLITSSQVGLLPTGPKMFLLFRPDGHSGYTATVVTIPEPTALALLAIGVAGLLLSTARKAGRGRLGLGD